MKAVRNVLVLSLLLFLSVGCDVAFQGLHASASDTWTRKYTLAQGGKFNLSNVNGTIEVSPSADATTVEVVAERTIKAADEDTARQQLKSFEITEKAAPDEISIQVPRHSSGMGFGRVDRKVNFKVKVPKNVVLKVSTVNGEVQVAELSGPIKADAVNGEVRGVKLTGPIDAGTTNGRVNIQVSAVAPDGIRLNTVNGVVTLRVPSDAKASIFARWVNGGCDVSGLKAEGQSERRRYEGKLNGGGPRIEVGTTNGAIKITSEAPIS